MGGLLRVVRRAALATVLVASMLATSLGGIIGVGPSPAGADPPPSFAIQTILFPGNGPMAFAYAPDGRIFVGAKAGIVSVYTNGVKTVFADFRRPENNFAKRNLRSIVLDPNFSVNRRLYAILTDPVFPADGGTVVRVAASVSNPNVADMSTLTVLLSGAPVNSQHVGGDLEFDLNGNLLVTEGDGFDTSYPGADQLAALDLDQLNGKLLRISPETGLGVPANPYYNAASPGAVRSKVLARGFRNPFRFSVDPQTGNVLVGDVGWATWEEEDVVPITWTNPDHDLNFGWPCYEGANGVALKQPSFATDPATSAACAAIYTPAEGGTGIGSAAPLYAYNHNDPGGEFGSAIMGGPVYTGSQYPSEYLGRIFLADEARDRFQTFDRTLNSVFDFGTPGGWGNPVDIEMTPQGTIAFLSFGSETMSEIVYSAGNHQPIAAASGTPTSGNPPLTVQFSSAGSSDPDNDPLTYSWNFGDGSAFSTLPNPSHQYTQIGSYDAVLTVSDGHPGGTGTAMVHIDVGNTPPTVSFINPPEGTTYNVGDSIPVSIVANDPEDGSLTGNSVTWEVTLHHLGHIHPADQSAVGTTGTYVVPDHGEDTYLEFIATATDSKGASTSTSRFLYPNKVPLTVTSRPAGASVILDSGPQLTTYSYQSIVGGGHEVIAPLTATMGGIDYRFVAWHDGATTTTSNAYTFTTHTTATTVEAEYRPVAPSGNLVTNPSFESGITGYKGNKASLTTEASADAPEGANVLRVTHSSGSNYGVKVGKKSFTTSTGTAYTAEAHIAAATSAAIGTDATLNLVERSSSGVVLNQWLLTRPLSTSFQPFRVVATGISPGSTLELSATAIPVGATGTNAFYIDMVSLVPKTDPGPIVGIPAGNLISNPSFETDTVGWTLQRATLARTALAGAPDGGFVGQMSLTTGTSYSAKTTVAATALTSGKLYRAGAYAKAANADATGREVRLIVTEKSATGAVIATWTIVRTSLDSTFRFLSVEPSATDTGTMFEISLRGVKTTGTPSIYGDALTLS